MAYPSLKARFFVSPAGEIVQKAPTIPRSLAYEVFLRDGKVCSECEKEVMFGGQHVSPFDSIRSGAIDHIFPRSRGGQNDLSNLRLLCKSCNSQKVAA